MATKDAKSKAPARTKNVTSPARKRAAKAPKRTAGAPAAKAPAGSPTVFGVTRFNAAGAFAGVSFSPGDAELLAVTPGEPSSLVRRFAISDGAVTAERAVEGAWRGVVELPDRSWVLSSPERVTRISASGKERWRLAVGGKVVVSPDARRLAIFGAGKSGVFDAETGKKLFDSSGVGKEIFAASFSSDSKCLATGSQDGTLRLLDARGREVAKKKTTKILSVAFAPNDDLLLSGHGNGDVLLWDVPDLRGVRTFRGAKHTFEGGGGGDAGCRWTAFLPGGLAASLGNELLVRIWSIANGKEVRRIEVPLRHGQGASTALSSDGQWLAMGGTDGALSVWTTADGEPSGRGAVPAEPSSLALDATTVVVAGRSGFAAYRRSDGAVTELPLGFPPAQALSLGEGRWLLLDYNRALVVSSFEAAPNQHDGPRGRMSEGPSDATKLLCQLGRYTSGAAAVSSDGGWLAAPIGETVELRNVASGVARASLAHERPVTACAFFPGGDAWLVTAAERVHVWSLTDPPQKLTTVALPEGANVHGLAVSDGGRIAISYDPDVSYVYSDRSELAFIDPRSGKVTATLARPGVRLGQVAFVGGAKVAVTDSSGRLLLADGASGTWIDFPEGADVGLEAQTIRALPLAVSIAGTGVGVAHLGPDGNVIVRSIAPGKPETRRFELAVPPQPVRPRALFADRLRGECVLIGGKFGTKETRFVAETVKALGGTLATKPSANVTLAAFAHPLYGKVVPSANEKAIDRAITDGASITKLSPLELVALLLPTLEEASAMLGGKRKDGIAEWNAWRARYPDASGVFPAKLRGIDLSGADLRGARLASMHFEEAVLEGARLDGVDLFDTVFRGARMRGANLDGASCYRATFADADLTDAKLNCDLTWARLGGANLEGADLRKATLFKTDLEGAKTQGARMPARSR